MEHMAATTHQDFTSDPQLVELVRLLQRVLGENLVGAYLFGSATLGGLRPYSDIDVMAVVKAATTDQEKSDLIGALLQQSGKPRRLEVTIVLSEDIRPWHYPPRMDLQYGDWWRREFERGDPRPWDSDTNPDLATLIRMVLSSSVALTGPPVEEVFDPVPRTDYVTAALDGIDGLLDEVDTDTRNVILTLARMWHGLTTDELVPKDAAASWAIERMPDDHRSVLSEARAIYLGEQGDWSADPVPSARSTAKYIAARIRSLADSS
jgi:predicted nucleotidyltransferase